MSYMEKKIEAQENYCAALDAEQATLTGRARVQVINELIANRTKLRHYYCDLARYEKNA